MFYSVPCFQFLSIQHVSNTSCSLSPSSVSVLFPAQLLLHSLQKIYNQKLITVKCVNSGICFKWSFVHPKLSTLLVYHHPLVQCYYILSLIFQLPQVIIHNDLSWSSFSVVTSSLCFFPYKRWNTDHLKCDHTLFQPWNPLQVALHSLHIKYIIYVIDIHCFSAVTHFNGYFTSSQSNTFSVLPLSWFSDLWHGTSVPESIQGQMHSVALLLLVVICCSIAQSSPTLHNPTDCSISCIVVLHHLPELVQTQIHWVGDGIQRSGPLASPSAAPIFSSMSLFQWVGSSYQIAVILEFLPQHQALQWIFRIDFL